MFFPSCFASSVLTFLLSSQYHSVLVHCHHLSELLKKSHLSASSVQPPILPTKCCLEVTEQSKTSKASLGITFLSLSSIHTQAPITLLHSLAIPISYYLFCLKLMVSGIPLTEARHLPSTITLHTNTHFLLGNISYQVGNIMHSTSDSERTPAETSVPHNLECQRSGSPVSFPGSLRISYCLLFIAFFPDQGGLVYLSAIQCQGMELILYFCNSST